jgi:hypothetical protein
VASVDPTDARKAIVRSFGRSNRRDPPERPRSAARLAWMSYEVPETNRWIGERRAGQLTSFRAGAEAALAWPLAELPGDAFAGPR